MSERNRPLTALKNIGPVVARRLRGIGIADEVALRSVGPVAAYRRLKFRHPREITLVALYALYGALTDIHWNALPMEVAEALRRAAASRDV
ncbi:MAG: TfoX/Sxy family DNA transformation protein [Alphaproteobacteria bacterium]